MAQIVDKQDADAAEQSVKRRRSVVMALVLAGLAVLFFVTTIVRLGGNVALRGL
jgi:hypothetical protein